MIKFKVQYDVGLSQAERLQRYGIRKAIRIAVNRASAPVKASAVSHAERIKRFGFIAKSIRIRVKVYPSDRFVSIIGTSRKYVRSGKKITRGKKKGQRRKFVPANYAHLVEKGTKRSRAKPWLKPAEQASVPRWREQVVREVKAEIEKELARAKASGP